jgi:hypothetical protein
LQKQTWVNISGTQNLENIPKIHLTTRQIEVLTLVCKGFTNKQIADQLETVEVSRYTRNGPRIICFWYRTCSASEPRESPPTALRR